MAKKSQKPRFDFGEPSENAKRAIAFLRSKAVERMDDDFKKWAEFEIVLEELRRAFKISDYYGVDPRRLGMAEVNLIRLIARDFIDGFNPVSDGPGNPRSTIDEHSEIVRALFHETDDKGQKISQAIENVSKRGPGRGKSKNSLEGIYHRATKDFEREWQAFIEVCGAIRAQSKQQKEREEKYGKSGLLDTGGRSEDEAEGSSPIDE
jgi:hypothetical protein